MTTPVRAIYENGHLRLLDPVDLQEGEKIDVVLLSEREKVIAALGNLVVNIPASSSEELDEAALLKEIEEAFRGQPPLSETIIEERREGM